MSKVLERLRKQTTTAISEYTLIRPNDRIMVAVSGGKDSAVMLGLLRDIQRKAPYPFSLHPVLLDQKQPGFSVSAFSQWVARQGFELDVIHEDTYSIVKEKTEEGKSYCGLCSRLRRGILYNYAEKCGYQKIALGHHRDDLNTTLLMNLFFNGRMAAMPPKLLSDDERNVVIRPMIYAQEADIALLADEWKVPIIPCNLCGSQDNLQRKKVKALLKQLEEQHPFLGQSLIKAQQNIHASQLMDRSRWSFDDLDLTDSASALSFPVADAEAGCGG